MPDIREVLAALDPQDRVLWSQHRTEMRKSYMNAHNSVIGIAAWDANDDAFIDLIDIKLALIFDRSGRFNAVKEVASQKDANEIEGILHTASDKLKIAPNNTKVDNDNTVSSATAMMKNEWANA